MSLISSTLLFEAASISKMSTLEASSKALQTWHLKQGEPFMLFVQLTAYANIFAVLVLPVPRLPVNKYA